MEILGIEIKIDNLTAGGYPFLKNYGKMPDSCNNLSTSFQSGKVYGIIGGCGEGGWTLSHILTGRDKPYEGKVLLNGQAADEKILEYYGWYVGDGITSKGLIRKRKTIYRQIKEGIVQTSSNFTAEDITNLFGLSKDRIHYPLEELSWEKWRASIAIGFAHGKRIFCFPWCDASWVNNLILNCGIHICIDILKNAGAIIIFPTQKSESVNFFVDEIIHLNNEKHTPSPRAKEFVEQYFEGKRNRST